MKKKIVLAILLFVMGIYNVKALEIPVNSYVIGEYLFTREGSDSYNGQLSTDYIMLASKSITSGDLDDMVIYFKIGEDQYINGATGEEITDSFIESTLLRRIKYYDMKKIPSVNIRTYFTSGEGTNRDYDLYGFDYTVYDLDSDNNLTAGVDFYKTYDDIDLTLLPKNYNTTGSYVTVDIGASEIFTIYAYPYVEVVNRSGNTKKVYLEYESGNIISVNNDLRALVGVEDGKIKVSVHDQTGKKYKVSSATMYRYFENTEHNHLSLFDLVGLYMQDDEMKEMFDANTAKALNMVKESYNTPNEEIVDLYATFTNVYENMSTDIELFDFGNSENAIGGTFIINIQVMDEANHFYTTQAYIDSVNEAIVQPNVAEHYSGSGTSIDLLQTIALYNMVFSMS